MLPRVLLIAGLVALSHAASPGGAPYTIDVTHNDVAAGTTLRVTVNAAACYPLTVVLTIDGKQVSGTISGVPGSVDLDVPAGTEGKDYDLDVTCASDRWHEAGTVL